MNIGTGETYASAPNNLEFPYSPLFLFGDDGLMYLPQPELLEDLLRFDAPLAKFGKPFRIRRSVTQSMGAPGERVPPFSVYDPSAAKEYKYVIRFTPCPRGGRNVTRC